MNEGPRSKQIPRLIAGTALLLAGLAVTLTASAPAGDAPRPALRPVRVAVVEPAAAVSRSQVPGVVRAARRAELAPTVGARLEARPVEVGQSVRRGEVIARLDARAERHAVEAAGAALAEVEARLEQATAERRRIEQLFAQEAVTAQELERSVAAADALAASRRAAEARLGEANRLLGESVLVAPFDATVTEVLAEPGELVRAGQPVAVVVAGDDLELEVRVPESLALRLATGAPVEIALPLAGEATVAGRIRRVGRAAAGGRLFPVLVAIEGDTEGARRQDLLPGMSAEVRFDLAAATGVSLPLAAVLNPGGDQPAVFRLAGDVARRIEVRVIDLAGDRVVVAGDLAAGDRVIVTGHTSLLDGDRVEVAPRPAVAGC